MKKFFFSGLAIFLPIALTLFFVVFVFDLLTTPFVDLVKGFILSHGFALAHTHDQILIFISRLIVLFLLFAFIFLLGFFGQRFILSQFFKWTNALFNRIPIVKTIYRIASDISKNTFNRDRTQLFKGTAVVPFPNEKSRALGLISNPLPSSIGKSDNVFTGKEWHSVFVPTSPHPISGFLLMYEKKEVKEVNISTEDLLKFLLSCGIFEPNTQWKQKENSE